jgi:hypothetical protein
VAIVATFNLPLWTLTIFSFALLMGGGMWSVMGLRARLKQPVRSPLPAMT